MVRRGKEFSAARAPFSVHAETARGRVGCRFFQREPWVGFAGGLMNSINHMAERLRELLEGAQGIEVPGCYDVLSAMILERAGFSAVFMSGYGMAASLLGNPDIGLAGLGE